MYSFAMLSAIEFDHKTRVVLDEIQCIGTKRRLPAEMVSSGIQFAQLPPEALLDFRRITSQLARSCDFVRSRALEHALPPTRSAPRFDLPTEGEVK